MLFSPRLKPNQNSLITGHNLLVMQKLLEEGFAGEFQLIYFDGPFNSGRIFSAPHPELGVDLVNPCYERETITQFKNPSLYIEEYRKRILVAKELLHAEGFIVLQCNAKMGHYLKVLLDEIMGSENYLAEVIWKVSNERTPHSFHFGYNHEVLLFYSKTERYLKKNIATLSSLWDDVGFYETLEDENTFYPSQKPEKLMERIIELTTMKGDLVGDFYCGSGSFPYTAARMGRKWIACDQNNNAVQITKKRMDKARYTYQDCLLINQFKPEWFDGRTYINNNPIPVSLLELEGLKSAGISSPITVVAMNFSADCDLANDRGIFHFHLLVPLISPDGIDPEEWITIPRPVPFQTDGGYRLVVPDPFKWVLYNIVHVQIDDKWKEYLFNWSDIENRVNMLLEKINNEWIKEVLYHQDHVELKDVFGYSYHLKRKKEVG